jgi:hypothetical protein
MFTTKRFAVLLIAAMALPLLVSGESLAGGGFFPQFPSNFVLNQSKDVTATIVLDPNGPVSFGTPLTPTGTFGAISISRKHYNPATAVFRVAFGSTLGELALGCDLSLTNSRFVNLSPGQPGLPLGSPSFGNWLPSDVTTTLFSQLGVTLVDPSSFQILVIPSITGVISQQCAPFPPSYPSPPPTIPPTPPPPRGFLILEVTIGFWSAPGTPIPK